MSAFGHDVAWMEAGGFGLEAAERTEYQSLCKSKLLFLGEQSGVGLGWALGTWRCNWYEMGWGILWGTEFLLVGKDWSGRRREGS